MVVRAAHAPYRELRHAAGRVGVDARAVVGDRLGPEHRLPLRTVVGDLELRAGGLEHGPYSGVARAVAFEPVVHRDARILGRRSEETREAHAPDKPEDDRVRLSRRREVVCSGVGLENLVVEHAVPRSAAVAHDPLRCIRLIPVDQPAVFGAVDVHDAVVARLARGFRVEREGEAVLVDAESDVEQPAVQDALVSLRGISVGNVHVSPSCRAARSTRGRARGRTRRCCPTTARCRLRGWARTRICRTPSCPAP